MTKLSVNLNKVALLRNQRDIGYPSVVDAARTVIQAGAHGVTVHPRPDERHIRKTDVLELAAFLKAETAPDIEFNIEGNPTPDFLDLVAKVSPHQATLVPDAPDALTSDDGWDLTRDGERLAPIIADLKSRGMRVALFMNADPGMIRRAADVGADRVELYTGPYAFAYGAAGQAASLDSYVAAAKAARDVGLEVNAGHDLNLDNLGTFLGAIPWCAEVSIGHALTSDALWMGFADAVRAYLKIIAAY